MPGAMTRVDHRRFATPEMRPSPGRLRSIPMTKKYYECRAFFKH
jgi:hypothetical protein